MTSREGITVIEGGEVLTPLERIKDGRVLVRGARIVAVGKAREVPCPAGARRINAEGGIVIPGLMDTHLCGLAGRDCREGADALLHIARNLPRFGVTSFLPTLHADVSTPETLQSIRHVVAACRVRSDGAQLLGLHLEGPYLNPASAGIAVEGNLFRPEPRRDRKFIETAEGLLRMVTLSPELPGAIPLIRMLRSEGITVAGSHSLAGAKQVDQAVKAGMRHITHIFNAMGDRSLAEPGVLAPGFSDIVLLDDRLTVSVIVDGVHVPDLLVRLLVHVKGKERIVLATDSFMGTGMPLGQFTYPDGSRVTTADGRAHRLVKNGWLAGGIIALNRAVANMARVPGVELPHAVQMASTNPARLIGMQRRKGLIAPKNDADLAILDKELSARMTMVGGKVVYSKVT